MLGGLIFFQNVVLYIHMNIIYGLKRLMSTTSTHICIFYVKQCVDKNESWICDLQNDKQFLVRVTDNKVSYPFSSFGECSYDYHAFGDVSISVWHYIDYINFILIPES